MHHEHWADSVFGTSGADRPEEEAGESTMAPAPDHEHARILRCLQELTRGATLAHRESHPVRAMFTEDRMNGVMQDRLSVSCWAPLRWGRHKTIAGGLMPYRDCLHGGRHAA